MDGFYFNHLGKKGVILVFTFKTEIGIPLVVIALSFATFPERPVLIFLFVLLPLLIF